MLTRRLLTLALALVAALACTSSAAPPRPASPAGYRASAPARPGGAAVLADFEYPQALNPLMARTDADLRASTLLFAPLWGLNPSLQPYPDLVRRVPSPANGQVRTGRDGRSTTVDVRLVPGLRWSDGQPITADDLVFTWEALRDPDFPGQVPAGLDRIQRMDRRSATEVVWTLAGIDPGYVDLGAALFVLPAHRLRSVPVATWAQDGYFRQPDVVSGPFTVAEAVPFDHLILAANPRYTGGRAARGAYLDGGAPFTHAPYLEHVVLQTPPGKSVEVQSLLAEGIDAGFHLLPDDMADLQGATGSATVVTTGLRDEFLNPNHGTNVDTGTAPPWSGDDRVLQALDGALDRAALVRDMLGGAGKPARGLYPRALMGPATGVALPAGPGLEKAQRLLEAAGWRTGADGVRAKAGRRLAFALTGICGRTDIDRELDLIRRQWLPLGVAVTTGCEAQDVFFQHNRQGAFDMTLYSNGWRPDPGAWASTGVTGGTDNWNRCQDRALDAAFARLGGTLDPAARRGAAQVAEREWLRARCTIPLFEWPEVRQVSKRLRNFVPNPAAADSWNAADWWLTPA
ncbi:MAG TPA: ABC transporter substrate-binding protein [Candidatus Dormibacteraeota bacterium]